MNIFGSKSKTEAPGQALANATARLKEAEVKRGAAQWSVDNLNAKIAADNDELHSINADIRRVSIAIELSDIGGPGRDEEALDSGLAQRIEIEQRIERRQIALGEAAGLVALRESEVARLKEDLVWAGQAVRQPTKAQKLAAAIKASEAANAAWLDWLEADAEHVRGCPSKVIAERFGCSPEALLVASLDRAYHLHQLCVTFHPRYCANSFGGSRAQVEANQASKDALLTTRVLAVSEPPGPPPDALPSGMTRHPMGRTGRAA